MSNYSSIEFAMYENGLDFIVSSLEYLNNVETETSEDKKKSDLKYCLLNLSSGTELILKSRLYNEHWTYIFADMNKANKKDLQSGTLKSVDSNTTINRLERLCDIKLSPEEHDSLKSLRETRNRIEHFELRDNLFSVQSKVNKVLHILLNFISSNYDNLHSENIKHNEKEKELYEEITSKLATLEKYYKDALKMAEAHVKNSVYQLMICPNCREKFLVLGELDGYTHCCFCGYKDTGNSSASFYINAILHINEYEIMTQGGEYPLYECPNCGVDSLVMDEDSDYKCFSCGNVYEAHELGNCSDCGQLYVKQEEDFLNLCDNCCDYRMNKD